MSQASLINGCFTKKVKDKLRKCSLCPRQSSAEYRSTTATGNLKYHLWTHHRDKCEKLGIRPPASPRHTTAASPAPPTPVDSNANSASAPILIDVPIHHTTSPLSSSVLVRSNPTDAIPPRAPIFQPLGSKRSHPPDEDIPKRSRQSLI